MIRESGDGRFDPNRSQMTRTGPRNVPPGIRAQVVMAGKERATILDPTHCLTLFEARKGRVLFRKNEA
jgi:hypothetical protein